MSSGHDHDGLSGFTRRRFVGGAGAALVGGALAGGAIAGTRRTTATSAATAIFQEPDTLDPAALALISTAQVIQSMFDPLIYSVPGKGYFPGLATSFKVSKDGK